MTPLFPLALGLLLQSAALLGLGLLAVRLARRRGQAVQSLIGRATLAGVGLSLLLAAPLSGHVRPLWRVTLPSAATGTEKPGRLAPPRLGLPPLPRREGEEVRIEGASAPFPSPATAPPPAIPGPSRAPALRTARSAGADPPSPSRLLASLLAAAWATGMMLLLLWLGVCSAHLARLRRAACPVTFGPAPEILARLTPRPPALLAHASVRSPFLAGLHRPAIFLPADHDALFDPAALRAILAHELAHLARRDNAWTLAARLLCALLWPQPLLWLLCRRLEQIGEEACDEAVLAQDCPPRAYADCLLTLAEHHPLPRRERALGAGVAPFRSSLGRRVQRILAQGTHAMSTVPPRLRLTIAALTLAAVIGGAFIVSPSPAQVDQPVKTHADKPTLVGIWTGRPTPQAKHDDELIFGPQGDVAVVEERGSVLEYGRYVVNGSALTLTLTTPGKGRTYSHAVPFSRTDTYDIVNDILTLRYKTATPVTARRVSAYPEGVAIEAVAAQQAALLGAAQTTPRRSPSAGQAQLDQARFLAGLTPVEGPGVVVTLNDSKKPHPKGLPPGMTPPNLIHDTDINQVVNELKAAGAEAIAVNDQRLVTTSAIRTAGPTIFVNNTPQAPPYVIKAIGNPKSITAALNLKGGITVALSSFDPAMFSVQEARALRLPAYDGGTEPRYARPAAGVPPATSLSLVGTAPALPVPTAQEEQYNAEQQRDLHNLKAISLAMVKYEQNHDAHLPDANHWMDQITPFLTDQSVLWDPFQPDGHRYGYAFNRNCSGQSASAFNYPSRTVAIFDSTLGTRNASDTGASLTLRSCPSQQGEASPISYSGYAFVDANVEWDGQDIQPSFALDGGVPTVIGTWVGPTSGIMRAVMVFSPGGIVEQVSVGAGDTHKTNHLYGRCNVRKSTLKYVFTRAWVEGKSMYTIAPERHLVDYTLSGDVLTIEQVGKHAITYHRSHTYTVHKPKGFLWV